MNLLADAVNQGCLRALQAGVLIIACVIAYVLLTNPKSPQPPKKS